MKVVLVGYMASGKTSLGKLLAKELAIEFIDLDEYIEQEQQKSVKAIFAEKGEIYFRSIESKMLAKVLEEHEDCILSTGGGTPCYSNNMDQILEKSDHSIYLQLPISTLVERISEEKVKRPLVSHIGADDLPEFIGKHLFERRPFYTRAKHTLNCNEKDLETLANEVKSLLH
ncbi:AAA family ATPase [Muricauda sp. JGD-17]|uniref:Shikimate kinase n=1 Tax=Flagellimonas ochracea TaxID=2696472 RepID=A0A964TEB9_9FLAO|nr:shikimate kinase [Allomuricauda ochracea]NAY93349.1 AAA family ATPase [Allomuricauda ochracea]